MRQGRQPWLDLQSRDPSGADVGDGRELAGDGTIDDGACHLDAPVIAQRRVRGDDHQVVVVPLRRPAAVSRSVDRAKDTCPSDGLSARTRGRRQRSCRSPCRRRRARTGRRSSYGGHRCANLRAARRPPPPGIRTSSSTTSGSSRSTRSIAASASLAAPTNRSEGSDPHERPEHVDDGRFVVGDEHPDRLRPSPVRCVPSLATSATVSTSPSSSSISSNDIGRRAAERSTGRGGPDGPGHLSRYRPQGWAPALLGAARRRARPRCDGGSRACAGSRTRGCGRSSRR